MTVVLDANGMRRTLKRLASEIVEGCAEDGVDRFALIGIRRGGVPLAERLASLIEASDGTRPETGALDITLYRDDLYTGLESPTFGVTELPVDLSGVGLVLVDDVLFTGRTIRAALGVVHDYGRPPWVKLAVLVDRGHRELPIHADFTGGVVPTRLTDKIEVRAGAEPTDDDAVLLHPGAS